MQWPEASCIIALVACIVWLGTVAMFNLDPNRKDKE